MPPTTDPLVLQLTGSLPFILLLAVFFAAVASVVLLRAYRRAVVRSMRTSARVGNSMHRRSRPETPVSPPPTELRISTSELTAEHRLPAPVQAVYLASMGALVRNAAIYAVAGVVYAVVMALATLLSAGEEVSVIRLVVLGWMFIWPLALTLDHLIPAVRGVRPVLLLAYFGVWLALGALAIRVSTELTGGQLLALWLITNLPATALLLGFLNRRVRAVGPLVLVFAFLAMVGANLALATVASSDTLLGHVATIGAAVGLGAYGAFFGLVLIGLIVGGVAASRIGLRWIRRRYERKRLSDQTLTVDSIWLTFAVVQAIPLAFEGAGWVLSGVVAFALYKLVSGAGLARWARPVIPAGQAPRLLLLRVFALGRRSEAVFERFGKWWRHIGSVQMIAGPDLVTTTVEPHEFLDFLGRKLDRRFIADERTLELRISEMDLVPDGDGRFRVHDFFCHDDTWRMVLSRLVRESDVILMDLRAFSRDNDGCLYEIGELIDVAPLDRVVLLIDDRTDEAFLRSSAQDLWRRMRPDSPNRTGDRRLTLLRSTGAPGRDLSRLMRGALGAALPAAAGDERGSAAVARAGPS